MRIIYCNAITALIACQINKVIKQLIVLSLKTAPARQRRHGGPIFIDKVHFLVTTTAPARQRRHGGPIFMNKVHI